MLLSVYMRLPARSSVGLILGLVLCHFFVITVAVGGDLANQLRVVFEGVGC